MHRPAAALAALLAAVLLAACGSTTTNTVTTSETVTVAAANPIAPWHEGGTTDTLNARETRLLHAAGGDGFLGDDLDAFRDTWTQGDQFLADCTLRRMRVPHDDSRVVALLIALEDHQARAERELGGALGWCIGEEAVRK
jgi:hypothetical protein